MSAVGNVGTGFSLPYVAKYSASGGSITYSSGQKLARGVNVSIDPTTSENIFYADNVAAETANQFTGGTFNLTVDGLLASAEQLIMGLPAVTGGWYAYDDNQLSGYFGLGFIFRYMNEGTTVYVPIILAKTSFDEIPSSGATQEQEIGWQTQTLTGKVLRADDTDHTWKWRGIEYSTEAAAEAVIKTKFNIS